MYLPNLLTPFSTIIVSKLTDVQLVRKFPTFFGTQRFINMITRADHWNLPSASSMESTHIFFKIHFTIILPSRLRSSKWSLLCRFYAKIFYAFLMSPHACYMPHASHPPWFDHPTDILWRAEIMELLIMLFSAASCYFLPLRSKYFLHPVFRHPQSMFFPSGVHKAGVLNLFQTWIIFTLSYRPVGCKISNEESLLKCHNNL
jgi:hypothetical protein